ncbi:hypothetical protein Salat_0871800 [Sesamum alatum]|uniref:RNase H type-1 domain-containing protein n=1 Tax=Sesamum alatum TaxID=300844 RepID=A0AAE1YKA8_9LAMI|nr:hypothetical protein Salat_0871800 [Sesamum alatum]
MEPNLHRQGKSLTLAEEEGDVVVLPSGLWHNDFDLDGSFVVGRSLSPKPVNTEAFRSTMTTSFNPVKGMELRFIDDKQISHPLQSCFGSNPCYGKGIERFVDVDMEDKRSTWGSFLRIRAAIDVRKPLRRFTADFVDPSNNTPYGAWLRAAHPLLAFTPNLQPQTILPSPFLPRPLEPSTKVAFLIDFDLGDWNRELIEELFCPEDRDLILTPTSKATQDDAPLWHFPSTGLYTVRSVYHLACNLREQSSFSCPPHSWNFIQTGKIPQKIRMFAWRACRNALPTSSNLSRRIPQFDFSCPYCSASQKMLTMLLPTTTLLDRHSQRFLQLLNLNVLDPILQNGVTSLQEPLKLILMDRPLIQHIKQALAAREAISLAIQSGWNGVIIEGDCLSLLHLLESNKDDNSSSRTIVNEIRSFCSYIDCTFSFVRRTGNTVAHTLAKYFGVRAEGSSVLPQFALSVLAADLAT